MNSSALKAARLLAMVVSVAVSSMVLAKPRSCIAALPAVAPAPTAMPTGLHPARASAAQAAMTNAIRAGRRNG